jgi:hypothetical protein
MAAERVQFIKHKGKELLFLDFSECKPEEVLSVIDEAKMAIRTRSENSVCTLTDVTNLRFDDNVSEKMKAFTVHNKPYVKAAAVVGVVGIKKILFEAIMLFSRRKFHAFDTLEQAKTWLVAN